MNTPGRRLAEVVDPPTRAQLEQWLERVPEVLIYKHPPTCWAGVRAAREISSLMNEQPDLEVRTIDVLAERSLSALVAQVLGVRHESPQALLLREGEIVWSGAHGTVSSALIGEARAARPTDESA